MSRRGRVVVECDAFKCSAETVIDAGDMNATESLEAILTADGWRFHNGFDICPQCVEERDPREKDEDDGQEYGHPKEAIEERLRDDI